MADDTSAQTSRMLQREDNAKPKNQHKNKRRKSRDLSETSLPPEQNPASVSNCGPSQQQQHIQQRHLLLQPQTMQVTCKLSSVPVRQKQNLQFQPGTHFFLEL